MANPRLPASRHGGDRVALMSPPPVKRFFSSGSPSLKSIKKNGLLLLSCGACGREARECGQRGGRRPGVVHGLSTRPERAWAGPKGSSTNPQDPPGSRQERGPGIPFQAATTPRSGPAVSSHCSSPCCQDGFSATQGMFQAERRHSSGALNDASILLSGSVGRRSPAA